MKTNQTKPIRTSMFRIQCWALNVALALFLLCSGGALAAVRYVHVDNINATPPYTNWTTAATNIQDAVDAAVAGDEIVVSDGSLRTSLAPQPAMGSPRVDSAYPDA